jgi:hypothetical protein
MSTTAYGKIGAGLAEAAAFAKGEKPATRIHVRGYDYVPAVEVERLTADVKRLTQENERLRWTRSAMPEWNDLPAHVRRELSRPTSKDDMDGLFYDYLEIRRIVMGAE